MWKEKIAGSLKGLIVNLPDKVPEAVGNVLGQLKLPAVEERHKVRVAVSSLLGSLIQALNTAFQSLREEASASIVLLIDNLEKAGEGRRGRRSGGPAGHGGAPREALRFRRFVRGRAEPWYAVHPLVESCRKVSP